METIGTVVAANIKSRMKELGLSQADLAKKMGYKQPMISKWLSGKITPENASQEKLCRALECTIERLVAVGENKGIDAKLDEIRARMERIEALIKKDDDVSVSRASLLALISRLDESQVSLALTALQATFSDHKINVSTKINK